MKTPISYYGGKQKLAPVIIPIIPEHNLYCEPFVGGGAVFFTKERSNVEVLNDTNGELINFYHMVQTQFSALEMEVRITLHSRDAHRKAGVIYANPDMFSEVKRAWALWVLSTQSFASGLDNYWNYDKKKRTTSIKIKNKREAFTEELAIRLQDVQLESGDAIRIVNSRDAADSFFYLDPPYYNSDCRHYDGYTEQDFTGLLDTASKIKGKFLLSSYPSKVLTEFTKTNNWYTFSIDQRVCIPNKSSKPAKTKTEVFTANYDIVTLSSIHGR